MRPRTFVDYYSILEIERTGTLDEIKKAFRRLVSAHHPDHGGAADAAYFALLAEARDVLLDPARKEAYDKELKIREYQETLSRRARDGHAAHDLSFISTFVRKRPGAHNPIRPGEQSVTYQKRWCVRCGGYGMIEAPGGEKTVCSLCRGTGLRKK